MSNIVCEKLGIRYPIIQGAMTLISNAPLVSAVSNAGGLGVLSTGQDRSNTQRLAKEIELVKQKTDKPFAVNIAFENPIVDEIIDLVCESGVKVVTTGGGNPSKYMDKFRAHDITVIPVVPSAEVAVKMERAGVDMVIAEGMESGGYIGKITTMALIPQVVSAVHIPVIAAGGISDGRGMAACFILGARGIQMGTRFLASEESSLPLSCKKALLEASGKDCVVLGERIGSKLKHRSLRTKAADKIMEYEGSEGATLEEYNKRFLAARDRLMSGNPDEAIIGLGQGIGLIHEVEPAQVIVEDIMTEFFAVH